jgi:hypothetical protein
MMNNQVQLYLTTVPGGAKLVLAWVHVPVPSWSGKDEGRSNKVSLPHLVLWWSLIGFRLQAPAFASTTAQAASTNHMANTLTVTRHWFCNKLHTSNNATPNTYRMWWIGDFEDRKWITVQNKGDDDLGGEFFNTSYCIAVDLSQQEGWRDMGAMMLT